MAATFLHLLLLFSTPDAPVVVHVFVALCDNEHQGIVPVPKMIGNGDDPANNLYWGAGEGLKSYFGRQKEWKRWETAKPANEAILERCVFRNGGKVWLVADAYRGMEIEQCLTDFLDAVAGNTPRTLDAKFGEETAVFQAGGAASLVVFLGHNGLMDFDLPAPEAKATSAGKGVIVLCCMSEDYFLERLTTMGAKPLLLTRQLMYPGAFILKVALDGWLAKESPLQLRERAARAYAENQKIAVKAARGVFSDL